jgi:hypothetical protein
VNIKSHLNEAIDYTLNLFFLRPFLHHNNHALFLLPFNPLDAPALVDYAFEQALQPFIVQRPSIDLFDALKDFPFALRIIDTEVFDMFDPSDLDRAFGALVEQFNQFVVDLINFASPIFNTHLD